MSVKSYYGSRKRQQYLGKYRGVVTDNKDLEFRGRIKAQVPDVYGVTGESGWALPCLPMAGTGCGLFAIPPTGAFVWIEFEQGDPEYPIWTGGFWGTVLQTPEPLLAQSYMGAVLKTAGGSTVLLDDTPGVGGITVQTADGDKLQMGAEGITLQTGMGDKLVISPQGITLQTAGGQKLTLAASGVELTNGVATIQLQANSVKVNNGALEVL